MCWVLLGPLGIQIAKALHLDPAHKGLMVATPVLAGAFLRIFNGLLVDHFGAKKAGDFCTDRGHRRLAAAWFLACRVSPPVLLVGVVLGMAGASFAIALPMASRWYPPEHQGKAMGIARRRQYGHGHRGTRRPGAWPAFGWVNVFGMAAVLMTVVLACSFCSPRTPRMQPPKQTLAGYLKVLAIGDTWWFMLFYARHLRRLCRAGLQLEHLFPLQYGLAPVQAGYAVAACVFTGSLFRPIGGWLADKFGGIAALSVLYIVAAAMLDTGQPRPTDPHHGARRLHRGDDGAGYGQWRRVPVWCRCALAARSA